MKVAKLAYWHAFKLGRFTTDNAAFFFNIQGLERPRTILYTAPGAIFFLAEIFTKVKAKNLILVGEVETMCVAAVGC
jgi:hypothetical protein